ncbi:LPS export ABC transporter periplasmic protein LptC [Emcibacter sp.]|uniref:LPS export ABC transporter periplasmic protein LptC n=1 Tax=Emcibacter sp. TaxID=1979954 RepID=UPI002AA63377|nr:LPS export ABC transporter periplasmic protein LptC [Emcibacter sp.]
MSEKKDNHGELQGGSHAEHLENLIPRSSQSFEESQKQVEFIAILKKSFPVLTVIFLVALVLWPVFSTKEGSFTLAIDRLEKRDETAKLIKPRYEGKDRYNNPVRISAESAFRKTNDAKDYNFRNLLAEMYLKSGDRMTVEARSGILDVSDQKMLLDDEIVIQSETGFNLTASKAEFLINDKLASGHDGVKGSAPFGAFSSTSFQVNVDDETIFLQGDVKMHIDPQKPIETPDLSPENNN